jgi:hypothetical protein
VGMQLIQIESNKNNDSAQKLKDMEKESTKELKMNKNIN